MMRSLWLKLMGAFLLVVLVGSGIDIFLVNRSTQTQFSQYINQNAGLLVLNGFQLCQNIALCRHFDLVFGVPEKQGSQTTFFARRYRTTA